MTGDAKIGVASFNCFFNDIIFFINVFMPKNKKDLLEIIKYVEDIFSLLFLAKHYF